MRGYLPISLPSCFTAADFATALNPRDDSVVPKKTHCCFFFPSPNKRGWDINRLEEKQLFSARGGRVLLPCTRSLLEGSFVWGWILRLIACIGVVVKLSRGDLSSWCQGWPCLQPVSHRNRTSECESTDGQQSKLFFDLVWNGTWAPVSICFAKGFRFYTTSSVVHDNSTCCLNTWRCGFVSVSLRSGFGQPGLSVNCLSPQPQIP